MSAISNDVVEVSMREFWVIQVKFRLFLVAHESQSLEHKKSPIVIIRVPFQCFYAQDHKASDLAAAFAQDPLPRLSSQPTTNRKRTEQWPARFHGTCMQVMEKKRNHTSDYRKINAKGSTETKMQ